MVFSKRNEVRMVVGSPGGPFIINYVAKTLVAALDWGLDVQAAIGVPNFGSRGGPTLIERGTPYETLIEELRSKGHVVESVPLASGLHGIERAPAGWRGGFDPRRDGVAKGD